LILAVLLLTGLTACSGKKDAAEYIASGDAFVAQKKYPAAIIEYRNAVQQDPKSGEARKKLADAYFAQGNHADALRSYIVAADLLPTDAQAQLRTAEMLLAFRQFDDARARAEKALVISPSLVEAQIVRANALAGLDRLDEAVKEVEEAISREPDRSESYASLGALRMIRGDQDQAEASFKKAIETDPKSPAGYLALARFYWATKRLDAVETQLKAALQADPKNLTGNQALAYLYMATERGAQAEPYLKAAADLSPSASGRMVLADYYVANHREADARRVLEDIAARDEDSFAPATLRLASLDLVAKDQASALRRIEDVLRKQPKNPDALAARSQLQLQAGKIDEAEASARAAITAKPQSALSHLALARALSQRGDTQGAIRSYTEAMQLDPRLAQADVELARLYLQENRVAEAEQLARNALTKVAGFADAHLILARINLMKHDPRAAEPSLKALATAFPKSAAVQTQVGILEALKGNRAGARAAFTRALAEDPTYLEAISGLVQLDFQEKHPDAAKKRMEAALAARPQDGGLLRLAGRTYATLRDNASAERVLRQAIDVDPNGMEGYVLLGQLYASQQRLPDATAQFERLAEHRPDSVSAQTTVGMLLQMQNRPKDAQARYEQVLKIDPNAAVAANNLAWLYVESGENLDVALALAKTAQAHLPDRHEVNDTLGWAYFKKGLANLAVPPLRQAVGRAPQNAGYHYHLGMAYASLGEVANAKASLQKALALDSKFEGADEARRTLAQLKG
jgi:tetratricopeptide (TPR) repeat protein